MNNQRGYALIVSVLLLCTILIVVGATATVNLIRARQQDMGAEISNDAKWLAEGCAEVALQSLRADAAYSGNETITIGSDTCTIRPITAGLPTIIETEATVDGRPYRLQIEIADVATMDIASWQRVTSF